MQITDTAEALRVIKGIAGTAAPAFVEARADRPFAMQLTPGQEVRGEIVAGLENGRFVVKIAGELLDMNLPLSVKPGETVELTFLSDKPRLTFSLASQGTNPTPVSLSGAGRWLTLLARTPSGETLPPEDIVKIIQSSVKDAVFIEAEGTGQSPVRLGLNPGQQTKAEVMAELPNGRFQVKVGNELLEMNLPKGARPGADIQLMMISDKPAPMFAMAQPLQGSITAPLTENGKWLSFVARVNTAASPPPTAPLMPGSAETTGDLATPALAARLREALTRSGVFYESHVAEWATGRGRLEELLREPQGRLSPMRTVPDGAAPLVNPDEDVLQEIAKRAPTATGATTMGREARAAELADPQTLPLIRQQLAMLQTGHFLWQGEAWPGQDMEWMVGERDAEPDDGPGKQWNTMVSLDLPNLGKVRADLHLKNGRLKATVLVDSIETRALLRNHEQKLRESLSAAGIVLSEMAVGHEE